MKSLLSVLLLVASGAVAAEPTGETQIKIFRPNTKPLVVSIESTLGRAVVRSKTPHRQLNPEGKTEEFEGIDIRGLLGLTTKDKNSLVHFVGADGYVSTVPASILLMTNAILALKENGHPIDDHRGGLQVIFPTEGKGAVEDAYAKKAAFWCWYVRSIVIGDLENRVDIQKLNKAKPIEFIPPSVFQFEKVVCPKTVRIPLAQVTKSPFVVAELLSGKTKRIQAADFDLVLSATKKALPVICGGPLALADRETLSKLPPPILAKSLETNVTSISEEK